MAAHCSSLRPGGKQSVSSEEVEDEYDMGGVHSSVKGAAGGQKPTSGIEAMSFCRSSGSLKGLSVNDSDKS